MIADLLDTIHAAGWTWRDCKPSNLIWEQGRLRPIDFEGACRQSQVDVLPWGTVHYSPPAIYEAMRRPPGIVEDLYALGVIAFQFGVGQLPPSSRRARTRLLRSTQCPVDFADQILTLLEDNDPAAYA